MSDPNLQLTPEQAAAIGTTGVSVGLSAGAGSGKTFVLIRRFLEHLQPGRHADPLGGIVAITFTERAAREMRNRIRDACNKQLETCPPEHVEHWLNTTRRLDSARISTIHAFCAALLRSHAVAAGIDPQFELLDQALSDAFLRSCIDDALRDLLSRHDEDTLLLVLDYGLERVREQLLSLVRQRFQADEGRFEVLTPETLARSWLEQWQTRIVPQLLSDFADSAAVRHLLRLLTEHRPSKPEMVRRRDTILAGLPRIAQSDQPLPLLAELRQACQVKGGGGKSAWDDEDTYNAIKNSFERVRRHIDELCESLVIEETHVVAAAELSLRALRVSRAAQQHYAARKQESHVLDFDDLLLRTRDLLRDSPEVRQRAAAGIDFLMVDEFQDTDPVQAEIIRSLCAEQLLAGKLFFVGDVKQSIYRFRRADPYVFQQLREELPEHGRLPLSVSFRSQVEILKFVNCVFSRALGTAYEPLRPHVATQFSPKPAIEFLFPALPSDEQDTSVARRRELEADWIARRIAEFVHDPTPRVRPADFDHRAPRLRRAECGDIAILFRTLSNVQVYEAALRDYGLEYYLVGGRAFYAQQEIFDLVNLCRALDDVDDQVSLAGVLRSPFFSLSDDTLFALAGGGQSLGAALEASPPSHLPDQQREQVARAGRVIGELRQIKDRVPLAELLERALALTGYDAALLHEFLGARKLANLLKLIETARSFDRSGLFTLNDFVRHLSDSVAQQTDEELAATQPEAGNVVRLMTIHQSKGLEFPIVFVADMDWSKHGGYQPAYFHNELGPLLPMPTRRGETPPNLGQVMHRKLEDREEAAETTRLLYVATTRAADYLILSAGLDAERSFSSPWLELISKCFNLDTGLPAVDPHLGRIALGDVRPEVIPDIRVVHTPPPAEKPGRTSGPALNRLGEFVDNCEPLPLPESLQRLQPDLSLRKTFSVSEIEAADLVAVATVETRQLELFSDESAPSSAVVGEDISSTSELGTVVHQVLERINPLEPAAFGRWLDHALLNIEPSRRESLRAAAEIRVQAWGSSDIPSALAGAVRLFREIDFLLRWPIGANDDTEVATIAGQIDCLYQSPDGQWHILDYKTGRFESDSADRYAVQLTIYTLAARELIGRPPDSIELVQLGQRSQRTGFRLTPKLLSSITDRINLAIARLRAGLVQPPPQPPGQQDL